MRTTRKFTAAAAGVFAAVLTILSGIVVNNIATSIDSANINDSNKPIISAEARNDYKNNQITREVAKSRIDSRLESLTSTGDINGWNYHTTDGTYTVFLNDGTLFRYTLN